MEPSSRSSVKRVGASMRKWYSHLVQTLRFSARSFFQIICRQPSHLTHSPSVRTRFSSDACISLDSLLNHAKVLPFLVLNTPLREHAFFVGVLYLLHLRDRIGQLNDCRMCVAARQDHMHLFRLLLEPFRNLGRIKHTVA